MTAISHKPMDEVDLTNLFKSTPKLKFCLLGDGQCSTSVKSSILTALGEMTDLVEMRLPKVLPENKAKVSDEDFKALQKLTNLVVLDLRGFDCTEVSEESAKILQSLENLSEVLLSGSLSKSYFKDLGDIKKLSKVVFYDTEVNDMEWASLKDCS